MKVFISSTIEDLELYRAKAEGAVNRARCTPTLLKYWGPSGHPPLEECLPQVAQSDLLVVIVAYRYGWVPEDQPAKERKSLRGSNAKRRCARVRTMMAQRRTRLKFFHSSLPRTTRGPRN
jgi:hypothetical protein